MVALLQTEQQKHSKSNLIKPNQIKGDANKRSRKHTKQRKSNHVVNAQLKRSETEQAAGHKETAKRERADTLAEISTDGTALGTAEGPLVGDRVGLAVGTTVGSIKMHFLMDPGSVRYSAVSVT